MAGGKTGKKVQWSDEEDAQLRSLVAQHGTKKWSYISTLFVNKGSKQCRRRWQNKLSMDAKNTSWSAEEDAILLKGHKKLGNRWTEIARQLTGRTDNAVKNRFFALRKKKLRGSGGSGSGKGLKRKLSSDSEAGRGKRARGGGGGGGLERAGSSAASGLGKRGGGLRGGPSLALPGALDRKDSKLQSHVSGLSIDIPMQGGATSPSRLFAINLPKNGLTREDLCLIDEVNLLNTPLQIAVQDAMNIGVGGGVGAANGGGQRGGKGGPEAAGEGPASTSMSRFRDFMNWVFAPDTASLVPLSARKGGDAGTPPFGTDFNFAVIPESVRSVTRHLLTKQFAHIWTPKAQLPHQSQSQPASASQGAGAGKRGGGGGGLSPSSGVVTIQATGLTPTGGFTPVSLLRRSPRLNGTHQSALVEQAIVGMKVPSPTFSDHELDMLLSCMSPTTTAATNVTTTTTAATAAATAKS